MIKVNLLAQARREASPKRGPSVSFEGVGSLKNGLIIGMMAITVLILGWDYMRTSNEAARLKTDIAEAKIKLETVKEDLRVVAELEKKRDRVNSQIDLIAQLKKAQQVPVRLLDEISKNLPDFLWLVSVQEKAGVLTFSGRATTPTAYANFYNNLDASPYFAGIGKIKYQEQGDRGVSFSLAAKFIPDPSKPQDADEGAQ
jgi:type IV pilus assembly protein PilN